MSKIIVPIEMPETCFECPFHSGLTEIPMKHGLYMKFSYCQIAPEYIKDPWRNVYWQRDNREDWCPLEPAEAEDSMTKFERDGVEEYMKKCEEED